MEKKTNETRLRTEVNGKEIEYWGERLPGPDWGDNPYDIPEKRKNEFPPSWQKYLNYRGYND